MKRLKELALGFLALAVFVVLMFMAAGCAKDRHPIAPRRSMSLEPTLPLAYTLAIEGLWHRDSTFSGFAWINAWDDSTIDCIAHLKGYALWGPYYDPDRYQGDWLQYVAVFSLHIEPDSTITSRLNGAWMRDSVGAFTVPLPDSIGTLAAWVEGRYSQADSFYCGMEFDSSWGWVPSYCVQPGFRICAWGGAPKLEQRSACERLRRVGPHGGM